jgi:hypothetical protein
MLARLAKETGQTHQQLIDAALKAYERDLYLDRVNEAYAALRADPAAWREELAERKAWEATLQDGLPK